jgi:ADP-ribose diphosphatase
LRTVIPKKAKLIPPEAKRVFKGIIYDVYQWPLMGYDGRERIFEMLKRPDTIEVLALKGDKLIVVEETQPDSGPYYGLPGGRHDYDSETEVEAAKREMLEETGMTFKTWRLINVQQAHNKIEHFVYLFLATDFISQTHQNLDGGEKINVLERTLPEVKQLLKDPKTRYLPKDLLESVNSVQDILKLPEYEGVKAP